jgi:hypothetical protein
MTRTARVVLGMVQPVRGAETPFDRGKNKARIPDGNDRLHTERRLDILIGVRAEQ